MIIDKPIADNDIVSVKLMSGEEVIGRIDHSNKSVTRLKKPLMVAMTAQGPSLAPFVFSADITNLPYIDINTHSVVTVVKSHKPFADAYLEATTGLVAPSNALVV